MVGNKLVQVFFGTCLFLAPFCLFPTFGAVGRLSILPEKPGGRATPMAQDLDPLFRPRSVAFIGGSNLSAALRYHRDLGFSGMTHVVSPRHDEIEGFACVPRIEALAEAPALSRSPAT